MWLDMDLSMDLNLDLTASAWPAQALPDHPATSERGVCRTREARGSTRGEMKQRNQPGGRQPQRERGQVAIGERGREG
jgi:hypothetical protein